MEDSYTKTIVIDNLPCAIEVVDTAGTEQFLALQDLHIRNGQAFLLVFSLTHLASVNELGPLWDAIRRIKGGEGSKQAVPVVLAGNKSDLRSERQVPREVGTNLSKAWGNIPYYETSARKRINVDQIFTDLVRQMRASAPMDPARISNRVSKRQAATKRTSSDVSSSTTLSAYGGQNGSARCLLM